MYTCLWRSLYMNLFFNECMNFDLIFQVTNKKINCFLNNIKKVFVLISIPKYCYALTLLRTLKICEYKIIAKKKIKIEFVFSFTQFKNVFYLS